MTLRLKLDAMRSATTTSARTRSAVSVWAHNTIGRAMRQMHSGIWQSLTRNRRLNRQRFGDRHPHAWALTGRTELSFDTRRLEWLTLYEAARTLRADYSAVPLAPRATDPNPLSPSPKGFPIERLV